MYTDSHLCFIRHRQYPLEYESNLHSHDFYHMIYIRLGQAHILVKEKDNLLFSGELKSGQLHYLSRGNRHVITQVIEPLDAITILFSISSEELARSIRQLPSVLEHPNPQIVSLINAMLSEDILHPPYYRKMLNNHLEQLLYLLLRTENIINSDAYLSDDSSKVIQRFFSEVDGEISPVLEFMYKNIEENYSITELADACGYSESALRKLFRVRMKITPKEAYDQIKYFHALDLLNSGKYNISEIAELLGFNSVHYFSRFFSFLLLSAFIAQIRPIITCQTLNGFF